MKRNLVSSRLYSAVLVLIVVGIVFGIFFATKPDAVYALQSAFHMATLLFRFDAEVLLPTAYGRYYSRLYWKHNDELIQIVQSHPDFYENTLRVTQLFMPHIEAALDDRGNEILISQEQMDELQAALEEFKSLASEELRMDIEKEQQRTPLQGFVGMTVEQAMMSIESAWERDFSSIPPSAATVPPQETMTPYP